MQDAGQVLTPEIYVGAPGAQPEQVGQAAVSDYAVPTPIDAGLDLYVRPPAYMRASAC